MGIAIADPSQIDWSDLTMVKRYADRLAQQLHVGQTVILRPGHSMFNIIYTDKEDKLLGDAKVLHRSHWLP